VAISNPGKGVCTKQPSRDAPQYQTHLQLLTRISARRQASLDAIIVPASRPATNLDQAVTLARGLNCHLVVLCSLKAQAAEVNELLDLRGFTQAVVVDLPEGYTLPKLDLATSKPPSLGLPDRCVNPNGDLSTKRNIGLLLARMVGWERIFFLDDDIRDLDASDLGEVARMLGPYRAVGMRAIDFPDNSVVCHGHRKTGGNQDVFISGSVLAVHCTEAIAFFPEIYNEDWFFFYNAAEKRRLGRHGRDVTQLYYDPFADPQRAVGQEFGDIMAEGLYGLLHDRIGAVHATGDYWRTFLDSRIRFLDGVLGRSEMIEQFLRKRIACSINTAMAWTREIEPSMCEHYIALWQQDLGTWEQRLKDAPTLLSAKAALSELDLVPSGPSPHTLAGIMDGSGRQKGDGPTRDGIRRAGECVRRAIVAEERSEPADVSRNRDNHPLAVGRHRGRSKPGPALLSSNTEDAYSQQAFLTELSRTSSLVSCA
jgi:glycosyltransferase involved in cell wall biosynthesis